MFDVTLACVENHKHEVAGVVTILHDLTREREVAQMKNDFVSNVSHELRTPLATIKAYVEMLIDGEAHDEKSRRSSTSHPERGQPPRPADRQHAEHQPHRGGHRADRAQATWTSRTLIKRADRDPRTAGQEKHISLHMRSGGS